MKKIAMTVKGELEDWILESAKSAGVKPSTFAKTTLWHFMKSQQRRQWFDAAHGVGAPCVIGSNDASETTIHSSRGQLSDQSLTVTD